MKTEVDLKHCRNCTTENPFEYTFPLNEEDAADILSQVTCQDSWVVRTAMLPLSEANHRLQERLILPYMIESAVCRRFSETSQCTAVVVRSGLVWILCENRFDSGHKCVFFLGDEEPQKDVVRKLNWKGESGVNIAKFVSSYSGFREDYPTHLWECCIA